MSRLRDKPHLKNGVIYERIYEFTLYKDSTIYEYDAIIDCVKSSFPLWAFIEHDSDVTEDGELKKSHIHLLFRNDNALSINSVSENFGVPLNAIEWKSDWKLSVQYLVHYNDKNKYQYDIENIQSSYGDDIYKLFDSKISELDQVNKLFEYISNYEVTKMSDLMAFAIENNCYSALRRGSSLFNSLLREYKEKHIEKYKRENN